MQKRSTMQDMEAVKNDFLSIKSAADLAKRKLSLSDYRSLEIVMSSYHNSDVIFIEKAVFDYLKSFGIYVVSMNGYYYILAVEV